MTFTPSDLMPVGHQNSTSLLNVRYLDEQAFRYNNRKHVNGNDVSDAERFGTLFSDRRSTVDLYGTNREGGAKARSRRGVLSFGFLDRDGGAILLSCRMRCCFVFSSAALHLFMRR